MRSRNAAITELRKRESDLAEALAALERKNEMLDAARRSLADQDRLASVGLMSASIAHELNTPLAVLQGSIEKLLETVKDAAAQERLARMKRVTERLRKISGSLLDFARPPQYEMGPSRSAACRGSLGAGKHRREGRRGAVRDGVPAGDLVTGDADRLVQVFVNLLTQRARRGQARRERSRCTRGGLPPNRRRGKSSTWMTMARASRPRSCPRSSRRS